MIFRGDVARTVAATVSVVFSGNDAVAFNLTDSVRFQPQVGDRALPVALATG